MEKLFYTAPEVEILDVAVEGGFNLSTQSIGDSMDYVDGGTGVEMD